MPIRTSGRRMLPHGSPDPATARKTRALPRSLAASLAAVALVAGGLSGCTHPDDEETKTEPTPTVDRTVRVHAAVTRVAGRLSRADRKRVGEAVGALVEDYLTSAYVEGADSGFPHALSRFTPGARRLADKDRRLLTGVSLAEPDDVRVGNVHAAISVAAPHGRVVGATAWIRLALESGDRRVSLRGRLLLTRSEGRWSVFGYDVARSDGREGKS